DLVISAPHDDARMIAQALHLIDGLLAHVVEKFCITRIHVAAEHEILPDDQAQLVADVVEVVILVNASAPFTDHVHIGIASRLENIAISGFGDSRGKAVEGNYIGSFSEYGNTVDDEFHAAA